ncbi:MAG: DUF177 domain-containing protein [Rikenellaceae bacterium]
MSETTQSSYIIDFKRLDLGLHHFEYVANEALFAQYEGCELLGGSCEVFVVLQRNESMLTIDVDIEGAVEVECDRCLEPCSIEIDYVGLLVVKFSDDEALQSEYDGEILWLPTGATEVDLAQYIYESIILSLPYQRVHPDGECDEEMTRRFRVVTGEELAEIEANAEESDKEIMPEGELAKLAALKAKMNEGAEGE